MPLRACSFRFLSSLRRVLVAPSMRSVALLTFLLVSSIASAVEDPLKDAPPTYRDAMYAAMRSFTSRDLEGARAQVQKADSGYQQTPVSLNILGAVAIEQKKFEEGRQYCLQALNIDPKFFPARFNIAEIPFVQGKYAEARAMYERLQQDEPKDDLLKFRIFLTFLLEKNDATAREHLDQIPIINDTPISFYANAAWDFAHGDEAGARKWISSGFRTFPAIRHVNFVEVFYDLGWLKRDDLGIQPQAPVDTSKP
jgi:tetratricopeptide (TPR) repeat protein